MTWNGSLAGRILLAGAQRSTKDTLSVVAATHEAMLHSPKLQGMPTLEPIWGLDITRLTFN